MRVAGKSIYNINRAIKPTRGFTETDWKGWCPAMWEYDCSHWLHSSFLIRSTYNMSHTLHGGFPILYNHNSIVFIENQISITARTRDNGSNKKSKQVFVVDKCW